MCEQLNVYRIVLRFKKNNRVSATVRFSDESGDTDQVTEEGENIFVAITNALNEAHGVTLTLQSYKIELHGDMHYASIELRDQQGNDMFGSTRGSEMWNAFAMAYQDSLKEKEIPCTRFELMILDEN